MKEVLIKPADGRRVRLEDGSGYLAETGQILTLTGYWRRRETDGDVELGSDEALATAIAQRDLDAAPPRPARRDRNDKE